LPEFENMMKSHNKDFREKIISNSLFDKYSRCKKADDEECDQELNIYKLNFNYLSIPCHNYWYLFYTYSITQKSFIELE